MGLPLALPLLLPTHFIQWLLNAKTAREKNSGPLPYIKAQSINKKLVCLKGRSWQEESMGMALQVKGLRAGTHIPGEPNGEQSH